MRPFSFLLVVLFLCTGIPASACIWTYYGTGLDGEDIEMGDEGEMSQVVARYMAQFKAGSGRREQVLRDSTELARRLQRDGSYKVRNDYAVALIRLGHFQPALASLLAIEREHPGLYETASNIGTVYELLGRNDSARHWIAEGLRRNPAGHHGTEWLHLRILDAKLAMARDPRWLERNSVLGLDFGREPIPGSPRIPDGHPADTMELEEVGEALLYQLKERLFFAKHPDPVAADLLADLGNVLAHTTALQIAAEVYELALLYGPAQDHLVRARLAAIRKIIAQNPPSQAHEEHYGRMVLPVVIGIGVLLITGVAGVLVWRRRRRTKEQKGEER